MRPVAAPDVAAWRRMRSQAVDELPWAGWCSRNLLRDRLEETLSLSRGQELEEPGHRKQESLWISTVQVRSRQKIGTY